MQKFKLKSDFKPIADQQRAIDKLTSNLLKGMDYQVLLGVTGSGKTFSIANVIQDLQRPALIISHNKTLAAQLYQEFRDFFPENAVSYFVSYYDYYQPEAYIPSTDTYIEKDADINELIDKLRLAATANLLTRRDSIIIASVSCIYNIGSPDEYGKFVFEIVPGMKIQREQVIDRLVDLQYERGEFGFHRGTFRVRGNIIDIYLAYDDLGVRIELNESGIENIKYIDPVTGDKHFKDNALTNNLSIYPAKHYITDPATSQSVYKRIEDDLQKQVDYFNSKGKLLEANRIKQKVTYDLEMLKEVGYVKGIENYSRYFDGRKPGDPPFALLDYFNFPYKKDWLTFIDESHITFPQIRGMYAGDQSRKKTLIDYGFRLPASIDNRPLTFDEFMRKIPNFIATSATPSDWEVNMANSSAQRLSIKKGVVQQLLRPTGIPDPEVEIRPVSGEVKNVISEIEKYSLKNQRVLVTTLTKKTAEDLTSYLVDKGLKVQYLHSDIKTLERTDILDNLRRGNYDCIVGVNLLREGLDLPEVALVAILDADKEGFLRSDVSLIQTMGRAARHVEGRVILYADRVTGSMQRALNEVKRRRNYQIKMNKKMGITPKSIKKPFREKLIELDQETTLERINLAKGSVFQAITEISVDGFTPMERKRLIRNLRREMKIAAQEMNFELAAEIRDKIKEIE
jgi:excinuclease ABC subunit B